jgi:5-methylcytosine-specific restriction endonuclease McrA
MNCAVCSIEIEPHYRGGEKLYCSERCRRQARNLKLKTERSQTKVCANCQATFQSSVSNRNYCSKNCRVIANKNRAASKTASYYKELYPDGLKRKICEWCGEELIVPAQKTLASRRYHPECSKEAERARYRIKTTKRRTKSKPSRLSADNLIREYGANCHICNEPIDLELPRTSRMGLTVDHVIPLSKGGSDELDNLRPAHWICNNRKSDKIYA